MALVYDPSKHRPVKVILAVETVRGMDKAILEQLGGHEDRHELVNEAVQQYLVELRTGGLDGEPVETGQAEAESETPDSAGAAEESPEPPPAAAPIVNLADTAVRLPAVRPALVENEVALVRREPLLGLHKADVPSIAAMALLGDLTADGLVRVDYFYATATE